MMQVLVPLAGSAKRFQQKGYTFPKPLIEVAGRSIIEITLSSLNVPPPRQFVFVCRSEDLARYFLHDFLQVLVPGAVVVSAPGETAGAVCSALLAIDHIEAEQELLVVNGDQYIAAPLEPFYEQCREPDVDGCILTFGAMHPRWSFVRTDGDGQVVEVSEKRPISKQATAGLYYFRRAADFFACAQRMMLKGVRTANEFFVCPVYNEMILAGKRILAHHLPDGAMHSLGTPEDVEAFVALTNQTPTAA